MTKQPFSARTLFILIMTLASAFALALPVSASAAPAPTVRAGLTQGQLQVGDYAVGVISGFGCGEKVTITFANTTSVNQSCAPGGGQPVFQFNIPSSTTPGTFRMVAKGASGKTAETWLYVAPVSPQAAPGTYYTRAPSGIKITGTSFQSRETVKLFVNGVDTGVQGTATQQTGKLFALTSKVELTYAVTGAYWGQTPTFELRGQTSKKVASFTVSVAPRGGA